MSGIPFAVLFFLALAGIVFADAAWQVCAIFGLVAAWEVARKVGSALGR